MQRQTEEFLIQKCESRNKLINVATLTEIHANTLEIDIKL